MKRKILALLLVVVLSITVLSSCAELKDMLEGTPLEGLFPHEHTFSEDWSKDETHHWHAATCDHADEVADKAEHSYVDGVCICGAEEPEAPHEHSYTAEVTAPTCTEAGYTTYTCACGDSYTADETAALGHTYETAVTAPTCTEAGYTTYTCACGESYVADEVAALGHTEEIIPGKAATCTEAGLTDGKKCSVCGEILTAQTEIPALGHSYGDDNTCDVCGNVAAPDGTANNPFIATLPGSISVSYDGGADVWYAFTAPSTGKLIFAIGNNVTMGYYVDGSLVYSAVNDTKVTLEVTEGENYKICFSTTDFSVADFTVSADYQNNSEYYNAVMYAGENNVMFSEAEMAANTAVRTLVITKASKYAFKCDFLVSSVVDAEGNVIARADDYSYELAEGEYIVTFGMLTISSNTVADAFVSVTVTDKGATEPEEPDDPIVGESDLVIGENTVVIDESEATAGKQLAFIANAAGTYVFASNDLLVKIYDEDGMQISVGQAYLEAGNYIIGVYNPMEAAGTFTINVSYEAPVAEEGSENNPIVIETIPYEIAQNGEFDVYYKFVAANDCAVKVVSEFGYAITVDGEYLYGSDTAFLKAGQTAIINVYSWDPEANATYSIVDGGAYAELGSFERPNGFYQYDTFTFNYENGAADKFVWFAANIYEPGYFVVEFASRVNAKYTTNGVDFYDIVDATTKISVNSGEALYLGIQSFTLADEEITFVTSWEYLPGAYDNPYIAVDGANTGAIVPGTYNTYFNYVATVNGTMTLTYEGVKLYLYHDWDWVDVSTFETIKVVAGETYKIMAEEWAEGATEISFSIAVEADAAVEIEGELVHTQVLATPGNFAKSEEITFVVEKSGKYLVNVTGMDGSTWFQIYNAAEDSWTKHTSFPAELTLAAGSEVKYRLYGWSSDAAIVGTEVTIELYLAEEFEVEEPEGPVVPEGDYIEVKTTDTYVWNDYYSFTAPAAGKYTFAIPAGLGFFNKVTKDSSMYATPEIDYYDNENGMTIAYDLAAGETLEFYVGATKKATWYITYTFEAAEAPSENVINVTTTDTYGFFDEYTFVANGEGKYTFVIPAGLSFWSAASRNPEIDFQMQPDGGVLEFMLEDGEALVFQVGAGTKSDWTITYTFEACEVSEPETPVVGGFEGTYTATDAWGNSFEVVIDATTIRFTNPRQGEIVYEYVCENGIYSFFQGGVQVTMPLMFNVVVENGVAVELTYNGTTYTLTKNAETPVVEGIEGNWVATDAWGNSFDVVIDATTITFTPPRSDVVVIEYTCEGGIYTFFGDGNAITNPFAFYLSVVDGAPVEMTYNGTTYTISAGSSEPETPAGIEGEYTVYDSWGNAMNVIIDATTITFTPPMSEAVVFEYVCDNGIYSFFQDGIQITMPMMFYLEVVDGAPSAMMYNGTAYTFINEGQIDPPEEPAEGIEGTYTVTDNWGNEMTVIIDAATITFTPPMNEAVVIDYVCDNGIYSFFQNGEQITMPMAFYLEVVDGVPTTMMYNGTSYSFATGSTEEPEEPKPEDALIGYYNNFGTFSMIISEDNLNVWGDGFDVYFDYVIVTNDDGSMTLVLTLQADQVDPYGFADAIVTATVVDGVAEVVVSNFEITFESLVLGDNVINVTEEMIGAGSVKYAFTAPENGFYKFSTSVAIYTENGEYVASGNTFLSAGNYFITFYTYEMVPGEFTLTAEKTTILTLDAAELKAAIQGEYKIDDLTYYLYNDQWDSGDYVFNVYNSSYTVDVYFTFTVEAVSETEVLVTVGALANKTQTGELALEGAAFKATYADGAWTLAKVEGEAPHEHAYTPVVTAPTCVTAGFITYTCECGDSYTVAGDPATGIHTWVEDTNADDNIDKYCSVCTYVVDVESIKVNTHGSKNGSLNTYIAEDGTEMWVSADYDGGNGLHVNVAWPSPIVANSANNNYVTTASRIRLANGYTVTITYEGGTFDTLYWYFNMDYVATGTSAGARSSRKLYDEVVAGTFASKLGINATSVSFVNGDHNVLEPTELLPGYVKIELAEPVSELVFTTASGDYYVSNFMVDTEKTYDAGVDHPHTPSSDLVVVDPTCVEAGYASYTCVGCGESCYDVLPATGDHIWVEGEDGNVSSCSYCYLKKITETIVVAGSTNDQASTNMEDSTVCLEYTYNEGDTTYASYLLGNEGGMFTVLISKGEATSCRGPVGANPRITGNNILTFTAKDGYLLSSVSVNLLGALRETDPGSTKVADQGIYRFNNSIKNNVDLNLSTEAELVWNAQIDVSNPVLTFVFAEPVAEFSFKMPNQVCYSGLSAVRFEQGSASHEHSYEASSVTPATCIAGGYTTYTCACGDSYTADETEALGHEWADATYDAPKTCTVCGATEGEALVAVAIIGDVKYGTLAEAIAAAEAGDTVTLLENIVATESIVIAKGQEITLDLNGKVISMEDSSAKSACLIANNGTLTIVDGGVDGKLTFNSTTPDTSFGYATNVISNAGTLVIEGGIIENTTNGGASYAIDTVWYTADVSVTIKGGYISSVKTAIRQTLYTDAKNTLIIEGGEIVGNYGVQIFNHTGSSKPATLNITGGTITGNYAIVTSYGHADAHADTVINISGGTVNGYTYIYNSKANNTVGFDNVSISGGYFNGEVYVYIVDAAGEYAYGDVITGGSFNYEPWSVAAGYHVSTPDENLIYTVVACAYTDVEEVAGSCLVDGYTKYTCACGQFYYDNYVTAPGHTAIPVDGKDATCEEAGYTASSYCDVCGETIVAAEPIEALGHKYVEDVIAPTCTLDGYTEHACENCSDVYNTDTVPALGHIDENADYKCDRCSTKMLPAADEYLTIPQALAVAKAAGTTYTTQKYFITGIVTNVYNTQYGNMYLKDAEGNQICIYGLYTWDKAVRYDKMEYKPVEGDELTVYTVLGMYNTTAQGKDAWMDDVVAHEHSYKDVVTEATCTNGGYTTHTCTICSLEVKDTEVEALGHTTEEGTCERCGQEIGGDAPVVKDPVTFEFGANGSAAHVDGSTKITTKTWTEGDATLKLSNGNNIYEGSRDQMGNSCIKLGASSKAGSGTFTVDDDVTSVVIKVAKYKANTTKITINGTTHTLTKNSNSGEYDEIVIDTTVSKTITFTTVSGGYRAMINSITYYYN